MDIGSFFQLTDNAALKYANERVVDPEEHQDDVASIATDFKKGAIWAHSVLVWDCNDQ